MNKDAVVEGSRKDGMIHVGRKISIKSTSLPKRNVMLHSRIIDDTDDASSGLGVQIVECKADGVAWSSERDNLVFLKQIEIGQVDRIESPANLVQRQGHGG